jgi:dipeptidyl aminopeptidase/acylaminoacyl peptidase
LILLDLSTHEQHDLDLSVLPGISEDPLAALRKKAEEMRAAAKPAQDDAPEEKEEEDEEPGPRPVRVQEVLWSEDGLRVALHVFSQDHKDRWIAAVDLAGAAVVPLERIHDEAWINWGLNELGWLRDSDTLYYTSEESGYSQLYLRNVENGAKRRLTEGSFVVSDVQPTLDGRTLYYTANEEHPGLYDTFRVDIETGAIEKMTDLGGRNTALISPDGEHLLVTHSETTRPPEIYLQTARPGASARRVTVTISSRFSSLPWVAPEIVPIPSRHHDRPIYSRVYTPPDQGSRGLRPAVVFVHGAGYMQNSHYGWSSYFREFMFHTLLTQSGYVVLDMDYRASAGYGRDWRTAIYRQMGTPELEDLEDGVSWLVENKGVDSKRVGVYGGSYGGFMTFMALFREPDLFACGAALRPVTDWAHYNDPYTSRILNSPSVDPEAYGRSSPIEYADGLNKPLLIAHGMQDDNVFFQDTVRIVQRLIELKKENWEVAIYPIEPHGFREPTSWLDEYRRIFNLFETNLR